MAVRGRGWEVTAAASEALAFSKLCQFVYCRPKLCVLPALSCCREDSPESFHHELENIAWEENLRGCTENTFLALFEVRQGGTEARATAAAACCHRQCVLPPVAWPPYYC